MNRDSKGRFKRTDQDLEDSFFMEKINPFDRPPTVKMFILTVLVIWVISLFIPSQETILVHIKHKVCDYQIKNSTPSETFSNPNSATNPASTGTISTGGRKDVG